MLRELRIRNLAVIEQVTVPFAPGLNVLTGETGAGKSIVVDAVLLVRGARASADVIRTDADSALIEAVFERSAGPAAEMLAEAGLGGDDEMLVIRRELSRTGRHRAFVNDSPVTLALLERLGDRLVEVHGQHEHQRLLEPAHQLDLLDRFAGLEERRAGVAALHAGWQAAREALAGVQGLARDRAQREDLLRFQVGELDAARLRPGEADELRVERRRLQHAERFLAGLAEADARLDDDRDSARAHLGRASRLLGELARLDGGFAEPAEAVNVALAQVDEALRALRALRESVTGEPGRLQTVEDRLDALSRLHRKYGESEEAMLEFRAAAAAELERLGRAEELRAEHERAHDAASRALEDAAAELSRLRVAAGERLARLAEREVRALGMERALFEVGIDRGGAAGLSPRGWDRVEFRLSANPGEDPRPLARAASGGELSRAMLALRAVLSAGDEVATMVFDEIDAGIGGRTGGVVAERLAALAAGAQVLCVTHLPQIAARADHHLRVAKSVRGGRTRAAVAALDGGERVSELARMLGGETRAAVDHARELLARGRAGRRV